MLGAPKAKGRVLSLPFAVSKPLYASRCVFFTPCRVTLLTLRT